MTIVYSRLLRDPLCGMLLAESQVVATYDYLGQIYCFCCTECYDLFVRAPEQYIIQLAHESEGHCGYPCPQQHQLSVLLTGEQTAGAVDSLEGE